jgi:putative transposase
MRTCEPDGRKALLTMSSDERAHLLAITRSRSLPAALTLRAKIVLACEREPSNAVVATRLGVGPHTIGKWRKRFIADRIEGLYDEMRTGRPRTVEDEAVAELYQEHRPSPVPTLRSSTSPYPQLQALDRSVLRRGDVVGLYLNPPDKAVVLCVDEKRSHREWIATNALAE